MAIKATADEVVAESQLLLAYFPNCKTQVDLLAFISSRIEDVDAEVKLAVGANYLSTDANIQLLLHKAEIYLTLGRLWQTIKDVMDGYDAEALPPEFVEPVEAANNRDFYLREGEKIISRFETAPTEANFAKPYFGAAGTETDANILETMLGAGEV